MRFIPGVCFFCLESRVPSVLGSDMDIKPLETHVFVHSPLMEYSSTDNYYVSYAIRLKSNNPSFTHGSSHIRRRYSEFVHLRGLLASHHPTVKVPNLPAKNFFRRFNQNFIEERRKGLQQFLEEVLSISVYLSDKSLHLFLQSSSSMSEIDEECIGDIPAPQLLQPCVPSIAPHSDTSSSRSSDYLESQRCAKALQNLVLQANPSAPGKHLLQTESSSDFLQLPSSRRCHRPLAIPRRNGSLESSPSSSPPSSLEASFPSVDSLRTRRVSFNDRVQIAVVTNYGISVIRS